jgi:endonuclease-3
MEFSTTPSAGEGREPSAETPAVRTPETPAARKRRTRRIVEALKAAYPEARCALTHTDPFQLLVATILSAQCTDERVNRVTPVLFDRYPDARALASARRPSIESIVRSTGFYRNKAKSLQGAAKEIVERHGGSVPRTMEELLALPGVARKTANVVLGTAYGIPSGIVVDTHVSRITRLLALTAETDPVKIERDLMALVPKAEWIDFSHSLIHHGRRICIARRPKCAECALQRLCPSSRA